jgi:hypothetical protein
MPKYFCEYCGIYLTHSSPWGRKQHSHGRKHINNKIEYYSQFLYEFQQNTYNNILKTGMPNQPQTQSNMPKIVNINNAQGPQGMPGIQGMPNMQNLQKMIIPLSNLKQSGMQGIQGMPNMPSGSGM